MSETNLSQIMALRENSLGKLKTKYEELFPGQKAPSNNKIFMWRKIAYRLQELEYGGISAETQSKIQQLIQQYDELMEAKANLQAKLDAALQEKATAVAALQAQAHAQPSVPAVTATKPNAARHWF